MKPSCPSFATHVPLMSGAAVDDFPCGDGWIYSSVSGKCYKFVSTKKNRADAQAHCGTTVGSYPSQTKLATTATFYDMISVSRAAGDNKEVQWVGGELRSGKYVYMTLQF